jgi:hypothetical protein
MYWLARRLFRVRVFTPLGMLLLLLEYRAIVKPLLKMLLDHKITPPSRPTRPN